MILVGQGDYFKHFCHVDAVIALIALFLDIDFQDFHFIGAGFK